MSKPIRLLLVEDDPNLGGLLADYLRAKGYDVDLRTDGEQGWLAYRKGGFDLLVLDVMMPIKDGFTLAAQIRKEDDRTPIVFLTAKSMKQDTIRGFEFGADDYITKPFEESELLNAIEGRLKRSGTFRKGFDHTAEGLHDFLDTARGVAALHEISKDRKTRQVDRKETIYHEGDELRSVFFIQKGKVRTFKINHDGKELVTGLLGAGDFLGHMAVLEGGRSNESAEALEPCELAVIPREELLALLYKDRDVSIRFIKMLSREVKESEQRLLELAYASVRQRVAQALLRLHQRYAGQDDPGLGVRISREDLATIVGTATESLIRTLGDLKDEGLINIQGRDIRIADQRRLELLANR